MECFETKTQCLEKKLLTPWNFNMLSFWSESSICQILKEVDEDGTEVTEENKVYLR